MDQLDINATTISTFPHVFTDRLGEPIIIQPLREKRHGQLMDMYLGFYPRASFDGLPPASDEVCRRWVQGMITGGINLVAICFDKGVVGHTALFPMGQNRSEMLVVVDPAHQQYGIGGQLVQCVVQLGYELGFEAIWLSVSARNFVARHLYSKYGFMYTDPHGYDQLAMLLDLRQYHHTAQVLVEEVMNRQVISVQSSMSCREAIELFLHNTIAALPVLNDRGEVTGILSETDLIIEANTHRRVCDVATRSVITVQQNSTIDTVIRLFQSKTIRCIPVLDRSRKLIGVIGRKDILAYYYRNYCAAPAGETRS